MFLTICQTKNFNFWVAFKKRVRFFESSSKKEGSSLWAIFLEGSILLVLFKQSFQFFASCSKKKRIQFFASYSKTKDSILCVVFKKRVQLFASYSKKELNSLTHIKTFQLFESWKNNSLINFQWVILWKHQFFDWY